MITTFSGAHPYRPQCLITQWLGPRRSRLHTVELITFLIDKGLCPRCRGPLPVPPVMPDGSWITSCRCVPICAPCGKYESLGLAESWFVDAAQRDADLAAHRAQSTPGIIVGDVVVTEDGAGPVADGEHPGGWIEYGYDDTADLTERQR